MRRRTPILAVIVATGLLGAGLPALAPAAVAAGPSNGFGGPGDTPVPARPYSAEPRPAPASDISDPGWPAPAPTPPAPGTAEVVVPASGLAQVGSLPVYVGRPATGAGPFRVRVTVLGQQGAQQVGAQFFAVRVSRVDGGLVPAPVSLVVDYRGVRRAYGGDYATRLRLLAVPACAIATPDVERCATQTPLEARNDLDRGRLTADVLAVPEPAAISDSAASDPASAPDGSAATSADSSPTSSGPLAAVVRAALLAGPEPGGPEGAIADLTAGGPGASGPLLVTMSSSTSGSAGDYGATPMASSAKWQVGENTGNFSWSYPIPVPPAPAGEAPDLTLAYSSQSVDGRTEKENSQPSQVGEGWSLNPGFIERKFVPCTQDGRAGMPDLCDNAPEYYLNFGSHASEIVRVPSTNDWRLRDDPAWQIESWTQSPTPWNGDNFGDHWTVKTPDGTRYWFGYGKEPTTNLPTNSAWNVPVFGDDAGEPCYQSVLASAWCQRA